MVFVKDAIKDANDARMFMTTIALNAKKDIYKIKQLKLKSLNDVFKPVQKAHFRAENFVRNAIRPASYVLLALITIVLSVLMDSYKIQLIFLKARKNV